MTDLNSDVQLQLCFNRAHFQRSDFNVERFVNLARKRATLDQLQNDLRIYLRHLQNSMIELINDDYADFVNLSSSLAALKESVDKVSTDIQSNWSTFSSSIVELEKCADIIEQKLVNLVQTQNKQMLHRDKLALLRSIRLLHIFIGDCCEVEEDNTFHNTSWFSKLILLVSSVEFWSRRVKTGELPQRVFTAKINCYKKIRAVLLEILAEEMLGETKENASLSILLALLELIGEENFAVSYIAKEVINRKIEIQNVGSDKQLDVLLGNVLDQLVKIRERWRCRAKRTIQFTSKASKFMDTCILNFTSSFLEKRFLNVLIPTDAKLFHRCYNRISKFVFTMSATKESVQCSLFRSLLDNFNLIVYFKLATQPLLTFLKEQSQPEAFLTKTPNVTEVNNMCLSSYSKALIASLFTLYSDEVFLPALINKFWEFTLHRMDSYLQWAQNLIIYFSRIEPIEEEKSPPPTYQPMRSNSPKLPSITTTHTSWLSLATLYRDLQLFDTNFFQLCLNVIWIHLRDLYVDPTPFGQCLSHFSEQLTQKTKDIGFVITNQLQMELVQNLSAVSDIPRQYRWTKRPSPTGFSEYLVTAFGVCEEFYKNTQKLGWKDEELRNVLSKAVEHSVKGFCEKAEKVLESVEQTGSSLQRFKQRKATAIGKYQQQHDTGESDEAKIKVQLRFDVNLVQQRAIEYGMTDTSRLEQIEQKAATQSE